ncbi:MAG: hypothetical protein ABI813_15190 [Bacteroidota bacterium]
MPSMKTICGEITCLLFFIFLYGPLCAQVFTNDAGTREKHFIYEVKQIDEFFERFNNDTGSFIRKAYKTYHIKYSIDRPKLIKSLFNYETNTWNQSLIDDFVNDVTFAQNPSRLNFMLAGWYAEARCKFQYNGAVVDIPIILRIITDNKNRSKWMISAVRSGVLKDDSRLTAPGENQNTPKFINPASHASNFIELDKALNDKANLADYFETSFFKSNNAVGFYQAVLNNHAKFLYVKDITYHFLQAPGWIFTVEYFQRKSLNAGWLINSIRRASALDKKEYLKNLLEQ